MLPNPKLDIVLRADATISIGAGHVMRCANVLAAWQARGLGTAYVWGDISLPFVVDRLNDLRIRAGRECVVANPALVLVDHYSEEVRHQVARGRSVYVLVDDLGCAVPEAFDCVWNPNAYGSAELYPGFAGPVLTGPHFIPLRLDLPKWHPSDRPRMGLMLGGSAIQARLSAALDTVATRVPQPMTMVAVGGAWRTGFIRASTVNPWIDIAGCHAVVSTAGSSIWEAAVVGIPVAAIEVADNQSLIADWLRQFGVPVIGELGASVDELAAFICDAPATARRLPAVTSGVHRVVNHLWRMLPPR